MDEDSSIPIHAAKNVPIGSRPNVPLEEQGRSVCPPIYIKKISIEELGVEKASKGITWKDIRDKFSCSKDKARRKLKYFHSKRVLFTAQDLIDQGIDLPPTFGNRKPQRYYATCIKAEIIEEIKKEYKIVPVQPTGVRRHSSIAPLSNATEYAKAQNFPDTLLLLRFTSPYIHNLHILLSIDKEYYHTIEKQSRSINRGKVHEEYIGKAHVRYTYYPNGKVEILVACSKNPFKIETDGDVSILFSFLGQVKELLLIQLSDIRERIVPPITEWKLVQCDINKDVEITGKAQLTFPDIQLESADRVFRWYVKILQDKAVCRVEESLNVNLPLVEALDNISHPYKSIETKVDETNKLLKQIIARQGRQV
jgi:hypothetical protein